MNVMLFMVNLFFLFLNHPFAQLTEGHEEPRRRAKITPPAALPGNAVDLSPDLSFPGSGLGMPVERLCLSMNEGKAFKNAFQGWSLGTRKPMFFLKSTALAKTDPDF
ncbi:MAG: hypothetical protein KKD44_10795 [Proteobacteria bacterium]|nr:hypothetical protein [Pseudomonadota bacterium]